MTGDTTRIPLIRLTFGFSLLSVAAIIGAIVYLSFTFNNFIRPTRSAFSFYLNPEKIEHLDKFAYRYRIDEIVKPPIYQALGFQNWIKFYDGETPLNVYYSYDSINPMHQSVKDAKGYYAFLPPIDGDQYLIFSPLKKPEANEHNRFKLVYTGPHWSRQNAANSFSANDTINSQNFFFSQGTVNGIMIHATDNSTIGVGANGINLYTYNAIRDSIHNFYPKRDLHNTAVFTQTILDFFKKLSILRAGNGYPYKNSMFEILALGEAHCGNFSGITQIISNYYGFESYIIGSANTVWGHTFNLITDKQNPGKFFTVDLYSDVAVGYTPGDDELSRNGLAHQLINYHLSTGRIGLSTDYLSNASTKTYYPYLAQYGWLADIYRNGMQVMYDNTELHPDTMMISLDAGDTLVLDSRGVVENSRSNDYLYLKEQPKNHLDGIGILTKLLHKDAETVFSSPFAIRHLMVESFTGDIQVSINDKSFSDVIKINSYLKDNLVHNLSIKTSKPLAKASVIMMLNPYILKFRANNLDTFYNDQFYDTSENDIRYHVIEPGQEYVTLAWHGAGKPQIELLNSERLDSIKDGLFH